MGLTVKASRMVIGALAAAMATGSGPPLGFLGRAPAAREEPKEIYGDSLGSEAADPVPRGRSGGGGWKRERARVW